MNKQAAHKKVEAALRKPGVEKAMAAARRWASPLTERNNAAIMEICVNYLVESSRARSETLRLNAKYAKMLCSRAVKVAASLAQGGMAQGRTTKSRRSAVGERAHGAYGSSWRQELVYWAACDALFVCGHVKNSSRALVRGMRAALEAVMPLRKDLVLELDAYFGRRRSDIPAPDRAVLIYRIAGEVEPGRYGRVSTRNPEATDRTLQKRRRDCRAADRDSGTFVVISAR